MVNYNDVPLLLLPLLGDNKTSQYNRARIHEAKQQQQQKILHKKCNEWTRAAAMNAEWLTDWLTDWMWYWTSYSSRHLQWNLLQQHSHHHHWQFLPVHYFVSLNWKYPCESLLDVCMCVCVRLYPGMWTQTQKMELLSVSIRMC